VHSDSLHDLIAFIANYEQKYQERMTESQTLIKREREQKQNQKSQIALIKAQNEEMKQEFAEKEKRYKSKIEKLKRQNKKLRAEKMEIQGELKKVVKERIEYWIHREYQQSHDPDPLVMTKRERMRTPTLHKQQFLSHRGRNGEERKHSISKTEAHRVKLPQNWSSNMSPMMMIKREDIIGRGGRSGTDPFDLQSIRSTMTANRANMMNHRQNCTKCHCVHHPTHLSRHRYHNRQHPTTQLSW